MKRLIASSAVLAAGIAFLVGCGDENTTNITENTGMSVIEKGGIIPNCTAENAGSLIYVSDYSAAFYCAEGKWEPLKGEKGDKGDTGEKGDQGIKGDVGSRGIKGDKGNEGEDGSSCSVQKLESEDGYKVLCGGDSVGVLLNGDKGDSGVAGAKGLSAYEIAKAGGYTGTEEQWIASLKGDPGAKGDSGVAGARGLSAYEIAKASGYTGTEEQWLESLKGTPGAKGDSGVAGLSAYDIAKAGGYTGIEEDWIASLKGDPGDPGTNCEIVNDEGNVVELKCGTQTTTLYKTTVCGKTPYDPNKKFCYGVDLYDYCDGKTYNPDKQFCAKFSDESKQIYKMTTIKGVNYTKTWMAENLNYETASGSYCFDDKDENCEKYGRLYTWATAVGKSEEECGYGVKCNLGEGKVRGVCPKGWHLPDTTEWNALFNAVGGEATLGTMLKSTDGWNDKYNGTSGNGSDNYSFSALPAGFRNVDGVYDFDGRFASFWSSTKYDSYSAYETGLDSDFDLAGGFGNFTKDFGLSVRCLKD